MGPRGVGLPLVLTPYLQIWYAGIPRASRGISSSSDHTQRRTLLDPYENRAPQRVERKSTARRMLSDAAQLTLACGTTTLRTGADRDQTMKANEKTVIVHPDVILVPYR